MQDSLPANYAERIMQLEATIQDEGTMDVIRQLNDLYRTGIDYYIEKQPKKALHFQKKMTNLLANPDNIRILQKQIKIKKNSKATENLPTNTQQNLIMEKARTNQEPNQSKLNTRKIKEEVSKFHSVADTCIKNMVDNSNKMVDKFKKIKNSDLNRQEEQLQDRIMLKRVKSQEKLKLFNKQNQIPLGISSKDNYCNNGTTQQQNKQKNYN